MMTKTIPTLLATACVAITSAQGASILFGGFDGNQTQTALTGALNNNSGIKQLEGALQDAGAVGAVSTRIWTDQTTGKELQWSQTRISTTTGNWGLSDFTTNATTGGDEFVVTQVGASWLNYEITNTGTTDMTLDKFHISVQREANSFDTLTISLQQNGTFTNPVVLSNGPLTAVAPVNISLATDTNWNHYEIALSGVSSTTLGVGETATYRIANNVGTSRTYLDNIAISGSIVPEPSSAALLGLGGLALILRRRK